MEREAEMVEGVEEAMVCTATGGVAAEGCPARPPSPLRRATARAACFVNALRVEFLDVPP